MIEGKNWKEVQFDLDELFNRKYVVVGKFVIMDLATFKSINKFLGDKFKEVTGEY